MTTMVSGLEVDYRECGREPVHAPDAVQSYGILAAVRPADLTISHLSDNTVERIGRDPSELLGRSIADLIGADGIDFLSAAIGTDGPGIRRSKRLPRLPFARSQPFLLTVHHWDHRILVELEPEGPADAEVPALSESFCQALADARDLFQAARATVTGVRRIAGSDRVMVYRLLGDAGGEVVAEARLPSMTPFLGLRFPPHDYPPPAQQLLKRIRVREVPDTGSYPAAILVDPGESAPRPLDLGATQLRSLSRFCRQYYRNIGVDSSLTAAILVGDGLWGIISCHHRQPSRTSLAVREVIAEIGDLTGARIAALADERSGRDAARRQRVLDRIGEAGRRRTNPMTDLITCQPRLNALVGAGGIALVGDGVLFRRGWSPPADALFQLAAWLMAETERDGSCVFATDSLSQRYAPAESWKQPAAGLLAGVLSREPAAVLMCFRPELRHDVLWGGDPGRPVHRDEARQLHPRASFERWQEIVNGRCRPWHDTDQIAMAAIIGRAEAEVASGGGFRSIANTVAGAIVECSDWFADDGILRYEMFELVTDGMMLAAHCEPSGRATTVALNHRLCDLFEIDMAEAIGTNTVELLARIGLSDRLLDLSAEAPRQEVEVWSDLIGLRSVRVTREVVAETASRSGGAVLILIRLQDVTEFKRTADALKAAREQAQVAEQGKNQLLANMSHELRSPLNAIIGFAEAIKSEIAGPVGIPAYLGYAANIHQSGQHLLTLITDLLDMASLDAGRRLLREDRFDLADAIRDVFLWARMQFESKGLGWRIELPAEPIPFAGDAGALRQAIINLLTNAGKYTRPGGQVTLRLVSAQNRDLVVLVEDNGIGIQADDLARLFHYYQRGSADQIDGIGGTGLGLAITKALIELHGGSIELASDGKSGTTARLVLPAWRRTDATPP